MNLGTNDRQLSGMAAVVTHRVNNNLLVDLNARLGRRQDTGDLALSFEFKAHGTPDDLSVDSARIWYDAAHDAIYRLFLDATSRQLQEKVWKRR